MREFTVPAARTVPPSENLTDAVWANAVQAPDRIVFSQPIDTVWHDVTAAGFAAQVRATAKGLIQSGVRPGDRVGLMSRTRYEWTLLDYAVLAAGAVTVPVYETSSAEQVAWMLGDSEARFAVVETTAHAALVEAARGSLRSLREIWVLDRGAVETLVAAGADLPDTVVDERRAALTASSLATIIYTSGTTGRPKGCELTHGNLLAEVYNAGSGFPYLLTDSSTLLFLPLAHVLGRVMQFIAVQYRVRVGHTADTRNLLGDLATFRPTFLLSVPRVFEKVYNGAKQKAHDGGKGAIFDRAERVAVAHSRALDDGNGPRLGLRLQHAVFDRLVYARLRAALGGRCSAAISGGAPLGNWLGHFFRGIGLTVYEGYGLTETSAAAAVNFENSPRLGTVGRPVPGTSARIADDGEVLLKGDIVFGRYWHNDDATSEALTEGWFHTGDLGQLDNDGYLTITGRKKEIIVTAGGKNVAPAVLEDRLRAHPLISQCMVVGDGRPFIAALVTIDPEALPAWTQRHNKPTRATAADLREDPDLQAAIQDAVDEANRAVSRAESIRRFRILPTDFTEESGELTPSLKIKRGVVTERYAGEIAALYAEPTERSGGTTGRAAVPR